MKPEGWLGRTVLVVEDIFMVRRTLRLLLESGGYHVLEAEGGREALVLLKKGARVDLILLDIVMPDVDGMAFMRRLREQEATRNLPVVICSARGEAAMVVQMARLGVSGYIVKPFTRDLVLSKVDPVLQVMRPTPAPDKPDSAADREKKKGRNPGPPPKGH